jgi:hypothetical protein
MCRALPVKMSAARPKEIQVEREEIHVEREIHVEHATARFKKSSD